MNQLLRLLVVEDSRDDTELLLRELRGAGYETKFERVENAAAMKAALSRGPWDLVISDYRLPGFTGLGALALFKETGLDLPFIIVSGYISEAMAVQLMKNGAHDYIMKDNLARLTPAVARELREAAIRQDRRASVWALRESEQLLAANARQLEHMRMEIKAIDERLHTSSQMLVASQNELERRVRERTADLKTANAELQNEIHEHARLEQELLEIAERGRRRRGLDSHDHLSQKLMGISFLLKALEQKVAQKHLPRVLETRKIQTLIHEVINHTDELAHDFSALDLQGDDLAVELKGLAVNVKKMFHISCQFTSQGTVPRLPPNVTAQLYKIAKEAVDNAIRHGHATMVSLTLVAKPRKVILAIKDNGLPFIGSRDSHQGVGWRIMNSRASIIGALLEMKAQNGNGMVVICTAPISHKYMCGGLEPASDRATTSSSPLAPLE